MCSQQLEHFQRTRARGRGLASTCNLVCKLSRVSPAAFSHELTQTFSKEFSREFGRRRSRAISPTVVITHAVLPKNVWRTSRVHSISEWSSVMITVLIKIRNLIPIVSCIRWTEDMAVSLQRVNTVWLHADASDLWGFSLRSPACLPQSVPGKVLPKPWSPYTLQVQTKYKFCKIVRDSKEGHGYGHLQVLRINYRPSVLH